MGDWKADLENKFNIIKKEENNGQIISSARIINRNNSGSSRNVHRVSVHKEIDRVKEKEEKVMITKDAAIEDLDKIDVNAPMTKVIIEVGRILIKLLATIRSNQLLTEVEKTKIREARKLRDTQKETK